MDRRVKERLIGATILVALIVLIVPELLSGPKRPPPRRAALSLPVPTRSVSVDLATSKATTASAAADAASATSAGDDAATAPGAASAALSAPSAAAPDAGAAAGSASANDAGEAAPTRSDQPPNTTPTVTTLRAQAPAPALESHASTPKSVVEARKPSAAPVAEEASSHRSWALQLGSFANKENAEKLAHQLRAQRASVYVISSGAGPTLRYRVRVGPLRDREAAERAIAKLKSEGHPATLVAP